MKVSIKLISGLSSSSNSSSSGTFELVLGTVMQGKPGKSAYQYAKEAGYPGTEEEFSQALSRLNYKVIMETGEVNLK